MITQLWKVLTNFEKKVLLAASIVFLCSGALMASFYYLDNTVAVAARGGEFREGIIGQPVFINPVLPTTETDRDISRLIFGSLKDIVDSVRRSDDGINWNVRIKEGILWHDGERVTSDDVIFTLDTIQNRDARSHLHASFQGVSAERVSELEIKFTLQAPYAFFEEEHLASLYVIPKHIFGDLPVQNFRLSAYGLNPVGFGPYKVDGFVKDDRGVIQSFSLVASDSAIKKPNISKITLKFYRDEAELIGAYNTGRIDGLILSSYESLSGEEGGIKIRHTLHGLESSRYYAVFINQTLGGRELRDIDTREALSKTIGRQELIEKVFSSYATPLFGPTLLTSEAPGDFDPEVLEGLVVNLTVPDESFLVKTAERLKLDWMARGATVNVSVFPPKTIQEQVLTNTDYEFLLFGNITGVSNDLFSFWHSSRRFYPDQNLSLYQSSGVDRMLEDFRKDFDAETRQERLAEISDRIASDYPAVFLYSPDYIYVSAPSLHGFDDMKTMHTSSDRFKDIENWYVKTKREWK